MQNKTNTILLILIVILLALCAWFLAKKEMTSRYDLSDLTPSPTLNTPQKQTDPNWKALSSADLTDIISKYATELYYEKDFGLSLSQELDLTGDGVAEALIAGNGGNNGVTFILIKNSDGTISVAKQKEKDGTITSVSLLEVGRVMVSEQFALIPAENGFYTVSKNNQGEHFECNPDGVRAYSWNSSTKLFEYNQSLTAKYTAQVCK